MLNGLKKRCATWPIALGTATTNMRSTELLLTFTVLVCHNGMVILSVQSTVYKYIRYILVFCMGQKKEHEDH
jgi:hypothetical protein